MAAVAPAATLAGFRGPAAHAGAVWAGVAEVLAEYWAEAAAEAEVWVPMAATVVEFPEPAGWPAVALARPAEEFPAADLPAAAEASGCPVAGSAVTGPAAVVLAGHWSVRS